MTDALLRARADLEAGRLWQARDRLTGLLTHRQDDEVLSLLADVHLRMGDLPKAGALLAALGREDDQAQLALAAWRQRHGDEDARLRSIPRPVRDGRPDVVGALAADVGDVGDGDESWGWQGSAAFAGCLLVMLALVALVVVGVITVVGWIV
ncbi:hypothetical protein ASE01_11265 [Nocardioides sp. Root190]|uniref:DUF6584 family protein n=1 Tax=Nocardioides sp. Root190 TaxID=1736488 RepID=UPI0006FEFE39|nr:DUF6584 family protein [Nocardioides sp. Root190]KRB77307.1 hypothetical protein ASE01_11265 [Nocardioides sp. Root190]